MTIIQNPQKAYYLVAKLSKTSKKLKRLQPFNFLQAAAVMLYADGNFYPASPVR